MKGAADLVLSSFFAAALLFTKTFAATNVGQIGELRDDIKLPEIEWGLTDNNQTKTCILLSGLFEIVIPYNTNYGAKALAIIGVPQNASVEGICDSPAHPNKEVMTLTWSPFDPEGPKHNLTFVFTRKGYYEGVNSVTDPYYELLSVHARIQTNDVDFPDAFLDDKVYDLTASNLGILSAPQRLSYYCKATLLVQFDNGEDTLGMSHVHAEAFHDSLAMGDGRDYGPKSFCAKDGFEVILMVITYVVILALIGLAIFYICDRRHKSNYVYF